MSDILLIGAGFSRNWGGWLATEVIEYLLGTPEVAGCPELRPLLWRHQGNGGFETALAELQAQYVTDPSSIDSALSALQRAITKMFEDMNSAFVAMPDWRFDKNDSNRRIDTFLTRFDAIFTLNQDLLLEHHYANGNIGLIGVRRWSGPELPGLKPLPNHNGAPGNSWAHSTWTPLPESAFKTNPSCQPIYKLRGSSNWTRADGKPLLIMGGEKTRDIGQTAILNWYAKEFEQRLNQPDSRLMVIGYGFRDEHINNVLCRATEKGLKLFIIAPEGADLARTVNKSRTERQIIQPTELELAVERALIGASRRNLSEIFGNDAIEFKKVMRFFDR